MKYSQSILALFATVALAQPHKQLHQHKAKHLKARDPAIAWVTEYEYTTEVVPVTATIWVSEGFVPPPETTSSSSVGKNTVPAQFFQPASKKPSSTTTTTSVLPTTTSVYVAPVPTTTSIQPTTSVAPVQVVEIPSSAPVPVAQPVPTTLESVYVAPATTPAPVVEAAPTPSSDSSSGSTGGECSKGSSCSGDITHYDTTGYGACGWQSDGKVENVLALSHLLMGTQSNGNPYCGKTVTVKLNGKSIVAKVVDKCMGCQKHAIDLSEAAFSQLEDMSVGRTQVEWYFN